MSILISIIGILFTILFVIGTHEFAHFMMARMLGVKVLRFSIGFGKTLWQRVDKRGTEYVFALIPLGGYVKMLDEREAPVAPLEKRFAFNQQPYYKKMLIVLAGPTINILCALLLYWVIFMMGVTTIKPIIDTVAKNSIAEKAGLQPKEEIVKVDGKSVTSWTGFLINLVKHAGAHDTLSLETISLKNQTKHHYQLNLSTWTLDGLTPDPMQSIGIAPYQPTIPLIIGTIEKNSPAVSTLHVGDKIIAVADTPVKTWSELSNIIITHPGEQLIFNVKRNNTLLKLPITIGKRYEWFQPKGYLGIAPDMQWTKGLLNEMQYGPKLAMYHAAQQLYDLVYFNFLLIGKLIAGKISLQSLGGPITIFDSAGVALNLGLISFLGFLAFLSISIGIINFLPIPGLDGGHLLLQTIECIIRREIPDSVLSILYRIGFGFVLFLLTVALVNDLLRLTTT